ncbi:crotonase/enoyl-CoA hydratase family protein [Rhodobacteraceae bacterium NNCM2]|nr:crotonase/enoyl-CoA hydratase family protein [Coraliihabitans acroporae]
MSELIEVTRDGAVQMVRFNRPEKKNAITNQMYHDLSAALEAGEADEAVHVHLLLGHPGAFTAGNDVGDFLSIAQSGSIEDTGVARYLQLQPEIDKPLIAAVDGLAVGIGTTLLFHCDMVFATLESRFITPFVNLGLVAENASSLLAPRQMGPQRAFELLAMGEPFTAERAREAGLVNAVLPPEELEPHALATARKLANLPQQALRLTKKLLKGDTAPIHATSRREAEIFAERLTSDEARQAFVAFMSR